VYHDHALHHDYVIYILYHDHTLYHDYVRYNNSCHMVKIREEHCQCRLLIIHRDRVLICMVSEQNTEYYNWRRGFQKWQKEWQNQVFVLCPSLRSILQSTPRPLGKAEKMWKQHFEVYVAALNITDSKQMHAVLLYQVREATQAVFDTFSNTGDDFKTASSPTFTAPSG